jgi:hypothetical protein
MYPPGNRVESARRKSALINLRRYKMGRKSLKVFAGVVVFSLWLVAGAAQVNAQDGVASSSADTRPSGSVTPDRGAQEYTYKRKTRLNSQKIDSEFVKYRGLGQFLRTDDASLRAEFNRVYPENIDLVPALFLQAKLLVFYAGQVRPDIQVREDELINNFKRKPRVYFRQTLRDKGFNEQEVRSLIKMAGDKLKEFN